MNKVSNENLKRALVLRSAEQYADATTYLNLACKDGNAIAFALMGVALLYGGWGLRQNQIEGHRCLKLSFDNGYKAARFYQSFEISDDDDICRSINNRDMLALYGQSRSDVAVAPQAFVSYLSSTENCDFDFTHLIQLNDAYVNYFISFHRQVKQQKMILLKKSADQSFESACRTIVREYYESGLCDLAAPYVIKLGIDDVRRKAWVTIGNETQEASCPARLRELYLYGEYVCQVQDTQSVPMAVRVYVNTKAAVSSALVTWWLVANKMGLYADLRKLISWWVLKTKKDPSVWEINVT